ncbi:MAG: SDR family oxidoreductase [Myxococcales bacterium]|nr:SDR family oxidoreductase [Myxococcales bacterium]MCB9707181.1 SDR family oxidoreductase [Myxococcales bacterium]
MDADSGVTFLTGFPDSFLARSVLRTLLENHPRETFVCLIHPHQQSRAEHEISTIPEAKARVHMVQGETFAMDFGLSGRHYLELANTVTRIHHCAATTFLGASKSEAKTGNLLATREVLEFAEVSPRLERLVHWSSALVSGKRCGVVREDELDGSSGFRNVIEETRFRAERIIKQAGKTLPVTILRPAIIAGDSQTGELDNTQGLFLLMRLMLSAPGELRIPLPALGDVRLNLAPMDYVVSAGCYLASLDAARGLTLHVVDPDPPSSRVVFELLSNATGHGLMRDSLAGSVLGIVLQAPGMQRLAPVPRAFLQQALTDVTYDARHASALLEGSGISCPPLDSYVHTFAQYVRGQPQSHRPPGPLPILNSKSERARQWSFR